MRGLAVVLILGACATGGDFSEDGEAESAATPMVGSGDPAYVGLYASHSATHYNGDIPSLELLAGQGYVRSRCYRASCALEVPETYTWDSYTSSSGKKYIRFWSWYADIDGDGNLNQPMTVADVYEVAKFSKGIKLRKSYSSRWQYLYRSTKTQLCTASGGAWANSACTCPGNTPGNWPATIYVAGAGGCIATPGASEDNCTSNEGAWLDDDANPLGAYCECPVHTYLNASGGCTAI